MFPWYALPADVQTKIMHMVAPPSRRMCSSSHLPFTKTKWDEMLKQGEGWIDANNGREWWYTYENFFGNGKDPLLYAKDVQRFNKCSAF